MQSNGPIGLDSLKTYGAYVHPSGGFFPAFSSRQALFQLDPERDVCDFWTLSIDVDKTSAYQGSAILIYHIIFNGERRDALSKEKLIEMHTESKNLRSEALHKWDADRKAKGLSYEPNPFAENWATDITAKKIVDAFKELPINIDERTRIAEVLKNLLR